ncbi:MULTISPECIES: phage tail sheath family protein [Pseudoalteromonas]|uniref:Phage tail sheath protein n=1 Tax=Pseudoalteromonas fuliginea TaxID=1872678 RepID=A0ABD3YBU5_9GAMM|nr:MULTISPECIES: phage tail sheath C-terminal domain-containing protein [Pseudoalteromonas]ALQ09367.1 phage tail protein [Pseudoalteromonas sp. Bsw20308]ATG76437.1 phage tail protein [Pseudoalteromonas sp. 1_2015MBL_MicDiv]KDC51660.1 phage tail sheath protein [Pseudoalteromonas sp. S3431]KDC52236.1 phage tail sheath protein [Pseudoalteromonas fuliginea]KJZ23046.1 phage tail sheath protein [Pseudoalteromonas fuliginea]
MSQYKTPDVYVREKSILPPSVAEVATAIPAFIGHTTQLNEAGDAANFLNMPVRITSMVQFEANFGGPYKESFTLMPSSKGYDITNVAAVADDLAKLEGAKFFLHQAVSHFFANGGGACYVVSIGMAGTLASKESYSAGIDLLNKVDEVTLISSPEAIGLDEVGHYEVQNKALKHAEKRMDRFALVDVQMQETPAGTTAIVHDSERLRAKVTQGLKYGASYYPYLKTTIARSYDEANVTVKVVEDETADPITYKDVMLSVLGNDDSTNTDYNAQIYNQAKAALAKSYLVLPPSPAVAGIIAKTDKERGVWKAPANVALSQVLAPTLAIDSTEQESLNVDAISGKSINAIRTFVGKGTLVWGARTLAGNDNEWRYVSVRRLFNLVEESIQKATQFAVFEPNTPFTWLKLKTMIESYLENLWRQGAFFGETPDQAFFVNVGLGQTMTEDDINNGVMNIEIGLAAVRPAEFIVLTFSHKSLEG